MSSSEVLALYIEKRDLKEGERKEIERKRERERERRREKLKTVQGIDTSFARCPNDPA